MVTSYPSRKRSASTRPALSNKSTLAALVLVMCLLVTPSVAYQDLDLRAMEDTEGFPLVGAAVGDWTGCFVASAGDVNGDSIVDIIIGAYLATPAITPARSQAGVSYVYFGRPNINGIPTFAPVDLGAFITGVGTGFRIWGAEAYHQSGRSVGCAGDLNGDGKDDIFVGAPQASPPPIGGTVNRGSAGITYIIFGRNVAGGVDFAFADIDLAAISSVGIVIWGPSFAAGTGFAVSTAGDVNGDGVTDIIIGAHLTDAKVNATTTRTGAGVSYVVYGTPFAMNVDLSTFGTIGEGFRILGAGAGDWSGCSVGGGGDVNGDGVDDVIVGASRASGMAGVSYVVFGKNVAASGTPIGKVDLAAFSIPNSVGFRIVGAVGGDNSGVSVKMAGDVNGDGVCDVIVGANLADPPAVNGVSRDNAGIAYVVFGRNTSVLESVNGGRPANVVMGDVYLSAFTTGSSTGFRIVGAMMTDMSGFSVSGAGDVNGDGIGDLVIGAAQADPPAFSGNNMAGITYVVYGRSTDYTNIDLYDVKSGYGLGYRILGAVTSGRSGCSVSSGDVNNDGYSDIIIGAQQVATGAGGNVGAVYVVYGAVTAPTSQPSAQPSMQPSRQPSAQPSRQPVAAPTSQPSGQPTSTPTTQPSTTPTTLPTTQPTTQPTSQPSRQPTSLPTTQPSAQPSCIPSVQPSARPSAQPSSKPSSQPTVQPSGQPTQPPSTQPTSRPSNQPSTQPTSQPTRQPSSVPTSQPSSQPSSHPSTQPSVSPSSQPSGQPSSRPSGQPSSRPSSQPSSQPTQQPSASPSAQPSAGPSAQPSSRPSAQPSTQPSSQPSTQPSGVPSTQPSASPSTLPSSQPSSAPSAQPSGHPSMQPSTQPTSMPSTQPSAVPSAQPSTQPTEIPTSKPSTVPTGQPSSTPSAQPSAHPSTSPSSQPTSKPSGQPSGIPSAQPSTLPSAQPTTQPSIQPSTQPTTRPTCVPSAQPSAQPSSRPTSTPTAAWNSHIYQLLFLHTDAYVDSVWVCGIGGVSGGVSGGVGARCVLVNDNTGEESGVFVFDWQQIVSVLKTGSSEIVLTARTNGASVYARCTTPTTTTTTPANEIYCAIKAFRDATFLAASYVPYPNKVVYVGWYNIHTSIVILDIATNSAKSYMYTAYNMRTLALTQVASPPNFVGSFVAGSCISKVGMNTVSIVVGLLRTDNGVLSGMALTPVSGGIVSTVELVNAMVVEYVGPDCFIVGGLKLSNDDGVVSGGMSGYVLRVNALYNTVQYCVRYVSGGSGASSGGRRMLEGAGLVTSVAKSMVMVQGVLYVILDTTMETTNTTLLSLLKVDIATGKVVQQAHVSALDGSSVMCNDVTNNDKYLYIVCNIHHNATYSQPVHLRANFGLVFSSLPSTLTYTNITLHAENVPFQRTILSIVTTPTSMTASDSTSSVGNSGPTHLPTVPPTVRPSILPTPVPSTQPTSTPTSTPTVSPQPTSQPSTSGPTNTYKPTILPTLAPTVLPIVSPTLRPTTTPTLLPTTLPTPIPTPLPTQVPTTTPTTRPTRTPSTKPTTTPRAHPTTTPTVLPTPTPTSTPPYTQNKHSVPSYTVGVSVGGGLCVMLICFVWYRYEQHKTEEKERKRRWQEYCAQQAAIAAAERLALEQAKQAAKANKRQQKMSGAHACSASVHSDMESEVNCDGAESSGGELSVNSVYSLGSGVDSSGHGSYYSSSVNDDSFSLSDRNSKSGSIIDGSSVGDSTLSSEVDNIVDSLLQRNQHSSNTSDSDDEL